MMQSRKACLGGQSCEPRTLAESISCAVFHSALQAKDIARQLERTAVQRATDEVLGGAIVASAFAFMVYAAIQ